ncbi:transcriptional regulator, XRE family [Methylobacterium sp. 4-46]|uniref:helix-turn-helix domain-containing protein n=1 Tax=unclassified Methylobacterium TaxID=2615210 RepID=UPI000165CAC8|nr:MULTISPECIES: XRE family transcriptional regulator [Methylobacterium]ACA18240.1 transcriptional regulator, XRE family [Methylobacterium sp. 4-46]WFT77536.1 XRE family transcriptional regulator [Methylobacterium nodulans]
MPRDEVDAASPAAAGNEQELLLGEQIRALRKIKGLTLQQIAGEIGVSIGYLSQIERNRSKLPIGVLKRIATILGVQLSWFFQPQTLGPPEEQDFIVRAGRRRRMSFTGTGIAEELLSPNLNGPLEVLLSTIAPGSDSDFYSHDGMEAGLVLAGTLDLWIGDRTFRLEVGDSFSFSSRERHRCANPGEIETKVVWIITPPHY